MKHKLLAIRFTSAAVGVALALTCFGGCGKDSQQAEQPNVEGEQPAVEQRERQGRLNTVADDADKPDREPDVRGFVTSANENKIGIRPVQLRRPMEGQEPDGEGGQRMFRRPMEGQEPRGEGRPEGFRRPGTEENQGQENTEINEYIVGAQARIKLNNGGELSEISIKDISQAQMAVIWLDDNGEVSYMQVTKMDPNRTAPPSASDSSSE